jgi:hypothetical protein
MAVVLNLKGFELLHCPDDFKIRPALDQPICRYKGPERGHENSHQA